MNPIMQKLGDGMADIFGGRDGLFPSECPVCHEPVDDECACQHEYRSEHDARAER